MSDYIAALQDAIHCRHGCESIHTASVPVNETFRGQSVWEGNVEVFAITDHPTLYRCFAWGLPGVDGKGDYVTVLATSLIKTAKNAVRAAISAKLKESKPSSG